MCQSGRVSMLLVVSLIIPALLNEGLCLGDRAAQTVFASPRLGSFPSEEHLWEGGAFKFLGSGIYYKKILFISVQALPRIMHDSPHMRH